MASADLKMQIVTALNNAGIKATEQEVDKLAQKLESVSKKNGMDKLEAKLTKLPGKMGDVVQSMGKFGKALGAVGLIIESAKQGWELGTWLNDKFVSPLIWAGEKAEEVAKKKIADSWDKAWKSMEKSQDAATKGLQQTAKLEDLEIQRVKELSRQYLKAYSAKNHMANASMDAGLQRLEMEQFEDEQALIEQGREDAIPELQAHYALLKQELQMKKELAAFDAKTEEDRMKAQQDYDNQLMEFDNKIQQKKEAIAKLDKQRDEAERSFFNSEVRPSNAMKQKWLSRDQMLSDRQLAVKDELEILEAQRRMFAAGDVFDVGQYDAQRAAERATLASRLSLEQRRLGFNYNSLVAGQGENLLGFGMGDSFQNQITQNAGQSFGALVEIEKNTSELGRKLDELLGVKQ